MKKRLMAAVVIALALLVGNDPTSRADPFCGPGFYYDASHGICVPYQPANPQPGYPQTCEGGWYDPQHGICNPYPPAYPRPLYPIG